MSEEVVRESSGTLADYSVREVGRAILKELDMLRNRIAELEAERRWTPVGERLPELGQVVSVIDMNDKDSHLDNLHQVAVWVELKGVKMFGFVTNTSWVSSDVTHWMPLPELPEATHDR